MVRNKIFKDYIIPTVIAALSFSGSLSAEDPVEQFVAARKAESSLSNNAYAVRTNPEQFSENELEGWKIFEQSIGEEKVFLHFPDKPAFARVNGNWGETITLDGKTEYRLKVPMPAISGADEEELFPMFIAKYSAKPYSATITNIHEEHGNPVLHIEAYNKKSKKMEHVKVVVTEKNFYVASIKYKKSRNSTAQPSLFLESIYVSK